MEAAADLADNVREEGEESGLPEGCWMVSRGAGRGLGGGDAGRVGVAMGLWSDGAPSLGVCSGLVVLAQQRMERDSRGLCKPGLLLCFLAQSRKRCIALYCGKVSGAGLG